MEKITLPEFQDWAKTRKKGREWFRFDSHYIEAYIRVTERYLGRERRKTLELAACEVDSAMRGTSFFTHFLTCFEGVAWALDRAVYIESVLNERLAEFFDKRGYVRQNEDIPPSFYLLRVT